MGVVARVLMLIYANRSIGYSAILGREVIVVAEKSHPRFVYGCKKCILGLIVHDIFTELVPVLKEFSVNKHEVVKLTELMLVEQEDIMDKKSSGESKA